MGSFPPATFAALDFAVSSLPEISVHRSPGPLSQSYFEVMETKLDLTHRGSEDGVQSILDAATRNRLQHASLTVTRSAIAVTELRLESQMR